MALSLAPGRYDDDVRTEFEVKLERLDPTLFDPIPSQTSPRDRRSLLACQRAVRTFEPSYSYLEIGSYLGGSLQPYVLDERCSRIYSIDPRIPEQRSERGEPHRYPENTTALMLDRLDAVSPTASGRITPFDSDSTAVDVRSIEEPPALCFIDGAHLDDAVLADAKFCLRVMKRPGLLVFHDAEMVYNGLFHFVEHLRREGVRFHAYNLPDTVFVVEIEAFPIHRLRFIEAMLIDNHVGYLGSLRNNDPYRRFANRPVFQSARRFKTALLARLPLPSRLAR